MRILCILQNAWGDGPLPVVFRPNPRNKSAKVIRKMVGDSHVFHFSNTTDVVTPTAKGKPKPNFAHFQKVIAVIREYDLVLVCGAQAKETVHAHIDAIEAIGRPVIFVPHPASRSLSNQQILAVRRAIEIFAPNSADNG